MNKGKIAVRYSKALFELALEKNVVDEIYNDLIFITDSIGSYSNFMNLFNNVIITKEEKLKILSRAFEGKIHEITWKFLWFLIEKQRDNQLYEIFLSFKNFYRKYKNIKLVVLTTAHPLSEKLKNEISEIFTKGLNANIELKTEINCNLLGGAIVRIDNKQLDLSVSTQLNELKKVLKSKVYTKDL
jgi:F-type H+-transporting ATPase subunit delta